MSGWKKRDTQPYEQSWRAYQERMRRQYFPSQRKRLKRGGPWRVLWLAVVVVAGCWWLVSAGINDATQTQVAESSPPPTVQEPDLIPKSDVRILLGNTSLVNLEADPITVNFDGRPYQVDTSLDLGLQHYLLKKMDRVNSRFIGIVAMAPDTGRVLAMAGFNKIDPERDPCLSADFPAASLFKIVTAAAAVEEKGYSAGSRFKFNGYKHTGFLIHLCD